MEIILTDKEEKAVYEIMNNQYKTKIVGKQKIRIPMSFQEAYKIYQSQNLSQYIR